MDIATKIWMVCAVIYLIINLWPHKDITKLVNGRTYVYLRRYYLWRSKWSRWLRLKDNGSLYLHIILRPDDDPDPHDHPWDFKTRVLWGGYKNELWAWKEDEGRRVKLGIWPVRRGDKKFRSASHIHRVILYERGSSLARTLFGTYKRAITLVRTGTFKQSWSFYKKDGPIPYWEYLGIYRPSDKEQQDDDL